MFLKLDIAGRKKGFHSNKSENPMGGIAEVN